MNISHASLCVYATIIWPNVHIMLKLTVVKTEQVDRMVKQLLSCLQIFLMLDTEVQHEWVPPKYQISKFNHDVQFFGDYLIRLCSTDNKKVLDAYLGLWGVPFKWRFKELTRLYQQPLEVS